ALDARTQALGRAEAQLHLPVLREQLRRALAALHRRVRVLHPARHPLRVGPRDQLPQPAAARAAEELDRRQLDGGRHVLLRLSAGSDANVQVGPRGPRPVQRAARPGRVDDAGAVQGGVRAVPDGHAGAPVMAEYRNRAGGVYALTTFASILPGHVDEVEAYLEGMPLGSD